jgi:hypothetical protein
MLHQILTYFFLIVTLGRGINIIPLPQMRKLRHREKKQLA